MNFIKNINLFYHFPIKRKNIHDKSNNSLNCSNKHKFKQKMYIILIQTIMKKTKQKKIIKSMSEYHIHEKVVPSQFFLLDTQANAYPEQNMLSTKKTKNPSKFIEKSSKKLQRENQNVASSNEQNHQNQKTVALRRRPYLVGYECENDDHQNYNKILTPKSSSFGKSADSLIKRGFSNKTSEKSSIYFEKPKRYQKFAFRSEKYSKLSSEAKTIRNGDEKKVLKLKQDIDYYKMMYEKSLKALQNMEKIMAKEKNKFDNERQKFKKEIKKLKNKLGTKKNNIGHLFSYKEFSPQKLISNTLIVEKGDQSPRQFSYMMMNQENAQEIIERYCRINEGEEIMDEEELSIQSK